MYPYINFFGYKILSYWVALYTGIIIGIFLILYIAKEYHINRFKILISVIFVVYIGLAFSHFTSFLIYYPKFILKHPWRMFIFWEGGLTAYGGIIGGVLGLFIVAKSTNFSFWQIADIFTPSLAIGFFFGRIGCFLNGCCYGIPTDLPWGINFTNPDSVAPGGVIRHPTQIYEAIGWFFIFLYLWNKKDKVLVKGDLFITLIVAYGGLRFIVERFRADSVFVFHTPLKMAQLIGLIIVIAGIYAIKIRRQNYYLKFRKD